MSGTEIILAIIALAALIGVFVVHLRVETLERQVPASLPETHSLSSLFTSLNTPTEGQDPTKLSFPLSKFIPTLTEDDVQWVVNSNAELGVKIGKQFFFLYKGESLSYGDNPVTEDEQPMYWRPVGKREFGECCHPINTSDPTKCGTVSLADSDQWKPFSKSA